MIFVMGGANNSHYIQARFRCDQYKLHHQK